MKAIFKGYIQADKNAFFAVTKMYGNFVIGEELHELKDNINADEFIMGNEYDVAGITK